LLITEASNSPELDEKRVASTPQIQRSSLVPYGYEDEEVAKHDVALTSKLFDDLQVSISSQAQGSNEKEKKLALHLGGYQQRAKTLRQKISEASDGLEKARIQLSNFQTMQIHEESALSLRLSSLRDEVAFLSRREREAQDVYRQTRDELEALKETIPNGAA
jgi:pre-mRNA-splicing factor CDC5/CEF1